MKEPENNGISINEERKTTVSIPDVQGFLYTLPDNAQDIGMRGEQQDCFAYSDLFDPLQLEKLGCLAVMADGMGGMENGRNAAMAGVETFMAEYEQAMYAGESAKDALYDAVMAANVSVQRYPGAGSTIIGAVVKKNRLNWISVGDSHIYLFRNGLLRQLNTDHIYAVELDAMCAAGEISEEAAKQHPERGALTSYLGMGELALVDQGEQPLPLRIGDMILLCSGGLYQTLSNEEMSAILAGGGDELAQDLVNAAIQKQIPNQDNTTAVMLKII